MMGREPRTRGVLGYLMDLAPLEQRASERGGGPFKAGFGPYGAFRDDGVWFIVNNEGVGGVVKDDEPYSIPLYRQLEGAISLFPELEARLTPADVEKLLGDELVDLADLIREFGGRLESNFWLWFHALSPQEATDVPRRTARPDGGQ